MIPAPMPNSHLADFLRRVADEVERGGSFEGSVVWGAPGAEIWDMEFPQDQSQQMYVLGMVRCGNQDGGQGGAWVIGQAEPATEPSAPVYDDERDPDGLRSQF